MAWETVELTLGPFWANVPVNSRRQAKALIYGWFIFAILLIIALSYLYVVELPKHIGFQTTVLIGIVLAILTFGSGE